MIRTLQMFSTFGFVLLYLCVPLVRADEAAVEVVATFEQAYSVVSREIRDQERDAAEARENLLRVQSANEVTNVQGGYRILFRRVKPPLVEDSADAGGGEAKGSLDEMIIGGLSRNESKITSVIVYDRDISLLRWRDEDGAEYDVAANIDFGLLQGLGSVEMDGESWLLAFLVETIDTAAEYRRAQFAAEAGFLYEPRLPPVEMMSLDAEPGYWVRLSEGEPVPVGLTLEMDFLIRYYSANESDLLAKQRAAQLLSEARAEYLRKNPPQSKETVINFWPVRSREHGP